MKRSPISIYSEDDFNNLTEQLVTDIIELRNVANVTQVSTEATYLADAENLCVVGITGNDVSAFLSMQEEKDKADQENWIDKNYWKVFVLFAPIVMLILGYVIIKSAA